MLEAKIQREIDVLASKIAGTLPAGACSYVMISGPTAVGKPFFANRLMYAVRKAMRSSNPQSSPVTHLLDLDYPHSSSALFDLIYNLRDGGIIFIYGDYALDNKFLSCFDPKKVFSVFTNTAPNLRLFENQPFTSANLRILRLILEQVGEGKNLIDVITRWQHLRHQQVNINYNSWVNADATFNIEVGYEFPYLMRVLKAPLGKALEESKETYDFSAVAIIEKLLGLFRGLDEMPLLNYTELPDNSLPAKFMHRFDAAIYINGQNLPRQEFTVENFLNPHEFWIFALDRTCRILNIERRAELIYRLRNYHEGKSAHSKIRQVLASLLSTNLSFVYKDFFGLWIFGSITKSDEEVGPCSDIDLIIGVLSDKERLEIINYIKELDNFVCEKFNEIMSGTGITIEKVFDISDKVLLPEEIRGGKGFASIFNSTDNIPVRIFSRDPHRAKPGKQPTEANILKQIAGNKPLNTAERNVYLEGLSIARILGREDAALSSQLEKMASMPVRAPPQGEMPDLYGVIRPNKDSHELQLHLDPSLQQIQPKRTHYYYYP